MIFNEIAAPIQALFGHNYKPISVTIDVPSEDWEKIQRTMNEIIKGFPSIPANKEEGENKDVIKVTTPHNVTIKLNKV
jgi:hypothetical protein